MSVPLDRLYNFLHDHCNHDVIIYHFYPHGSKKPQDIQILYQVPPDSPQQYTNPPVLFHDQEPLNFDAILCVPGAFKIPGFPHTKFRQWLGSSRFNIHDKLILVHSELNSIEVQKFTDDGAIPVYYWNHALIARDWFRYAEHDETLTKKNLTKKFLIYNRAWKGSREYRLKFADLLVDNDLQNECITSFNPVDSDELYTEHNFANQSFKPTRQNLKEYFPPNTTPSWASADYNGTDYRSTSVEIVLETLFDDSRWHITEKTLRAIATGQPFILCSTPGSLKYLQSYGFKTFSQCWDESYDNIVDPVERLEAIITVMKGIKDADIEMAREISQYNRRLFFSKEFTDLVVTEFQTNFNVAVEEIKKHRTCAYFSRQCRISTDFRNIIPPAVTEYVQALHASQENN